MVSRFGWDYVGGDDCHDLAGRGLNMHTGFAADHLDHVDLSTQCGSIGRGDLHSLGAIASTTSPPWSCSIPGSAARNSIPPLTTVAPEPSVACTAPSMQLISGPPTKRAAKRLSGRL